MIVHLTIVPADDLAREITIQLHADTPATELPQISASALGCGGGDPAPQRASSASHVAGGGHVNSCVSSCPSSSRRNTRGRSQLACQLAGRRADVHTSRCSGRRTSLATARAVAA